MSYFWVPICSEEDLDSIFKDIDKRYTLRSTNGWYKADGIKIYGYYTTDRKTAADMLFEYSLPMAEGEVEDEINSGKGIFAVMAKMASGHNSHGLKGAWGEDILENKYHQIELLLETECQTLFLVKRFSVYGVVNSKGEIIVPLKYMKIFYAGEFTLGFVENGMVGFMNLKGEVVISPKYKDQEGYNCFVDGKALACLANNIDACDHYMSHNEDCVGYPEYEECEYGVKGSTAYQGDSDILDAYEGDSSNMWNTD